MGVFPTNLLPSGLGTETGMGGIASQTNSSGVREGHKQGHLDHSMIKESVDCYTALFRKQDDNRGRWHPVLQGSP